MLYRDIGPIGHSGVAHLESDRRDHQGQQQRGITDHCEFAILRPSRIEMLRQQADARFVDVIVVKLSMKAQRVVLREVEDADSDMWTQLCQLPKPASRSRPFRARFRCFTIPQASFGSVSATTVISAPYRPVTISLSYAKQYAPLNPALTAADTSHKCAPAK